jgi:hypothetical protein
LGKQSLETLFINIFDSYQNFGNNKYAITKISFQLNEGSGMGHAEGFVKYVATLETVIPRLLKGLLSCICLMITDGGVFSTPFCRA